MRIDERALRPECNNLTLVRLVLASAVIVTHCYWRVHGVSGEDHLSAWLGVPLSVYAVDGFFFLSGFLVYPSLIRRGSVRDFAVARLARLWPALAVSVLGAALIGLFLTSASPAEYARGPTARFIGTNLTLLVGSYNLTGVRCGDSLCTINGSLWTLPWEARCYLALGLLFLVGLARPRAMLRLVLPLTLAGAILWHAPGVRETVEARAGHGAVFNLDLADRLWFLFAAGIAASLLRDRIRLSWWGLAALFAANLVAHPLGLGLHVRAIFIGYAVLCFGFLSARGGAVSGRWPDYSYGMYIYAFPIMMGVAAAWPGIGYGALAVLNVALTLPVAAFSWHYVEKPVLEHVRRRSLARRAPVAAAA